MPQVRYRWGFDRENHKQKEGCFMETNEKIDDRGVILRLMENMLDNPDENGIFRTTLFMDKMEEYIKSKRIESMAWGHADACADLDRGIDPKNTEIPGMLERFLKDFGL
jgi:hypothetical protein